MSGEEFSEWMAYATLNPIDIEARADWRSGMLAAVLANAHRDERHTPFTVADFMPHFGPTTPPAPQTHDEMLSIVQMLNAAFGGVDLREIEEQ